MSHSIYPIVKQIVESEDQYPIYIFQIARQIKNHLDDKAKSVKWMWDNHQIYKQYVLTRGGLHSNLSRSMKATSHIRSLYGKEKVVEFQIHNSRRSTRSIRGMSYDILILESLLSVLNDTDHESMLLTVQNIINGTCAKIATPLERCPKTALIEILLWKLTHPKTM